MIITIIILLIILSLSIILLGRNHSVYHYRIEIANEITKKAKEDLNNNREWRWRYDEFEKVSYDEMFLKFWKPLSSFYDEEKMLK